METHKTKGIGQIALQGGLKMLLSQSVKLFVQIASIVVLARLVTPEDFGLVAFLTSIFAFVGLFSEFGLTMAIVQREQIEEKDLNTLFRISAGIGILLLLCIGVAGLLTSWISGDARYQWIFGIFAAMFFLKSLSTVPQGLIRRRLQFGFLSLQEAGTFLFGALAAVAIATQGRGILALMAFQFIPGLLICGSSWIFAGWRPQRSAGSIQEASSYFSFGGAFTLVEIANTVCKHIDNLLIGKVWGMELLGQYTRAYALMLAPLNQVMGPIGTVLIPSFSRIHQNETEFKKLTTALFISFVGLTAPAAAFLIVYSTPVIHLLLGPGWEVAQKIFWWFAIAVFCKPLGCHIYWIFVSCGQMRQMMRWTTINMALTVCAILAGLKYGPIRIATLFSISEIALQIPIAIYLVGKTKLIPVGKWYKTYVLGLGLLAGSYCMLRLIQEKMGLYGLSTNAQLVVSLCLAAVLSISAILANPESRNLVKDCKDRIF
jgi:O-antigen/teichoic acid export membrane protein